MINTQLHITTKLKENLEEMLILSPKQLTNLIYIIIGILDSKSVVLSQISECLKDDFSKAKEESKIKRIYRFLTCELFNAEAVYYIFICKVIETFSSTNVNKKQYIIFDHTTIKDKFTILMFSLKIGKRSVPLLFRTFKYDDKNNKNFNHIKEELKILHSIFKKYTFDIILLADRGFKSVDLFEFIDKELEWKYCIRCTKDVLFSKENNEIEQKLENIKILKNKTKYFKNIKLTAKKYTCNLAVCKAEDKDDAWYIVNNLNENQAIREYKKRFDIEEMFKDMKSGGFNLEDTWTKNLVYAKNLLLCICIAYTWMIILGVSCSKDKKNELLNVVKIVKDKKIRIYSIFRTGLKWFKRCYNSDIKDYYLKFDFKLYQT